MLRRYIFSAAFGVVVLLAYYALRSLVPPGDDQSTLTTVAFIVLAVLILFPARDRLARALLNRSDYAALSGHDFHHLDFLSGHFGREALIFDVTPELLEWLGCRSALLANAEPLTGSFQTYRVRTGAVREANPIFKEQLARCEDEIIKRSTTIIYDDELYLSADLLAFMRAFGARVIVPFVYRHRLLGFLLLQQIPTNRYAAVALDTYAGKAAVGLHNYILSVRLVEPRELSQERATARKIQSLLQLTTIPRLPGYNIRRIEGTSIPVVVEFFPGADTNTWYLTVLCSAQPGGSAALLLFGMLGCLYSYANLRRRVSLHQLVSHLKRDPGLMHSRYRAAILVAELHLAQRTLTVLVDGRDLDLRDAALPTRVMISPGWRNYIDLAVGHPLRVLFMGDPILEIALAENVAHEASPADAAGAEASRPGRAQATERTRPGDPKSQSRA